MSLTNKERDELHDLMLDGWIDISPLKRAKIWNLIKKWNEPKRTP